MSSLKLRYTCLDTKTRSLLYTFIVAASLIFSVYYIGNASISQEYEERLVRGKLIQTISNTSSYKTISNTTIDKTPNTTIYKTANPNTCENQCRPIGSESLPKGIVSETSDLEMRPLWDRGMWRAAKGDPMYQHSSKHSKSLLAMAVGVKQKNIVNEIVKKFMTGDFVVMLFHYNGGSDEWKDLTWSDDVIHVSAMHQTKWWFAKRFLHPDVVAEYNYIFLWDEDLGVEHFDPGRYLSIVEDEGLEISQPALDPSKSEVHHLITVRQKGSKLHRYYLKTKGQGICRDQITAPPCAGWVEMMAPVFSRAAWRCTWYMIQSDLIHAWGLDFQLGYCAQGDRSRNVGIIDSEYISHLSLPTLGGEPEPDDNATGKSQKLDNRLQVRLQSSVEMDIFKARWKNASMEDGCWVDPYRERAEHSD